MPRKEFNNKTRLETWNRADGKCEECGVKLQVGDRKEFDHRVPCALGGDNSPENCVLLCSPCHREKTSKTDVPRIAKAKRVAQKHLGIQQSKTSLPFSKNSRFKKTIGGKIVPRE